MGFGLKAGNEFVDGMGKVLSHNYEYIPRHLKDCMLFLSSYPDDVGIYKEKLIW